MAFISGVDFDQVKQQLQQGQFYVWGDKDNKNAWFVAEKDTQKDSAHIHMFTSGGDLNALVLTFVNKQKQHVPLEKIKGSVDEAENWWFSTKTVEFNGDQVKAGLKKCGASDTDAESLQTVFYAVQVAIVSNVDAAKAVDQSPGAAGAGALRRRGHERGARRCAAVRPPDLPRARRHWRPSRLGPCERVGVSAMVPVGVG